MSDSTFNILIFIVACCIAGASYAKGMADGWNKGFESCSDIWDKTTREDKILDDEVIDG